MKNKKKSERLPDIDHLPKSLKRISQVIGLEQTVKLSKALGGGSFYICGTGLAGRKIRNRKIRAEYDRGGVTAIDLARKFGLGQRTVELILSKDNDD